MTLRYGHLAPEHLRIAVARLDAALPAAAVALPAKKITQEITHEPVRVS
jgi:hypothetical protein